MSAYVQWLEDYSFSYASDATTEVMNELLMLNVAPFNWGQFVVSARSWRPVAGSGAIRVHFETSVDGALWSRTDNAASLALTPSNPIDEIILSDADIPTASPIKPGVSRFVRLVFMGNDGANAGTVHVSARALLKNV